MSKGKVYIVGAGPGDPLLITLGALEALKNADIVVYDHLVPKILIDIFSDAEKIYVGKEAGKHTMSQDEINELLLKYAAEGKKVVRFKGGDPFIFGRGGEECEFLAERGIDFEVIPGISSFYSALAYAGIPVTHRDFVSSFVVATGSEADKPKSNLDFSAISRCGTIIFLMTVRTLPKVVEELMKYMNPKTPCAIVQNGTLTDQRVVLGELDNIVEKSRGITPPAVFVVGDVVKLSGKISWFEKKVLRGKKIVITRPKEQSYNFAYMIWKEGGEAILFPSIKIEVSEKHRENIKTFCRKINDLEREKSLIVFTSQNGVEIFFNELFELGFDSRFLYGFKISAVGEKTAQSLRKFGIVPDIVPPDFSTEALLREILKTTFKNIFFVRAEGIRNIEPALEESGRAVMNIEVYRISKYPYQEEEISELMRKNPDVLTFTSSLSFEYFSEMFPEDWIKEKVIACIGRITARTVEKKIKKYPEIVSEHHTIESLFQSMLNYFRK